VLKSAMTKNIVLVGFMGAGKSVVSKQLATRLKRERVSTDELIEQREGRAISDIFQKDGEAYFRSLEKQVVAELTSRDGLVIDCGGGIVLAAVNIDNLRKNGVVFYLKADPQTIYERIKDEKHRPLLADGDPKKKISDILAQRKPFYEKADVTVATEGKTAEQVVDEIISKI